MQIDWQSACKSSEGVIPASQSRKYTPQYFLTPFVYKEMKAKMADTPHFSLFMAFFRAFSAPFVPGFTRRGTTQRDADVANRYFRVPFTLSVEARYREICPHSVPVTTYLKLVAVALFWGGTFIAGRIVASEIPHMTAAALRFAVASGLLWLLAWKLEGGLPKLTRQQMQATFALGATGIFLYNICFFRAGTDARRAHGLVCRAESDCHGAGTGGVVW
jgi:hypothetical protein